MVCKLPFYDTNGLLNLLDKVFNSEFVCSSKSLEEIEHIKVSDRKDQEIKYKARKLIRLLDENKDKYDVVIPNNITFEILNNFQLEKTPDNIIMACAYDYNKNCKPITFISDDICCKVLARNIFDLDVEGISDNNDVEYKGFKEVVLNETEMAYFYSNLKTNIYDLLINEYLIIKNIDYEVIDCYRWDGDEYIPVRYCDIKSIYFGTIKPYEGDVYQQLALNSLSANKLTLLKGSAGTGKTYLALGYLFHLLDKKKIDKIIIFCNTVATANSARLGYLPGSKDSKLLDSSIGNILSSKLGGGYIVEQLIQENKLTLLPMSDLRGFDTTGTNSAIFITEAQNMDVGLMKLALQRIGEDCICLIDGDSKAQVDMKQYSGANNGMRRLSEVFRGQDFYGEIELQNIYRSKIAKIAELM